MQRCWKQNEIMIAAAVTEALPAWLLKHLHSSQNQNYLVKGQVNDLVRALNLSKKLFEILASRLSEYSILNPVTKITFYRNRDDLPLRVFAIEDEFVYYNNISGLPKEMRLSYYN